MPMLVKLKSSADFQTGVTPDVLCWKGHRFQQEKHKAADFQREKSSASLPWIPFIQAESTSRHQLQPPSQHTSSGKLVSTHRSGKHHLTHPFGKKAWALEQKLSPVNPNSANKGAG